MPVLSDFSEPVTLLPGGHVVVFGSWEQGLEGRRRGLELRDTLLVLGAGESPRFAFLFRRDLEGTVSETVLKYGTGALNIDLCRVGTTKRVPGGLSRTPGQSLSGSVDGSLRRETGEEGGHNPNVGRWPTNLVFVHGTGCKRAGTREVKSGTAVRHKGVSNQIAYGGNIGRLPEGTPDMGYGEDGNETVPNWICTSTCPVKALDEQSGPLQSGEGNIRRQKYSGYHGGDGVTGSSEVSYGDTGGASRFFPQFENEESLLSWLKMLIGET